MTAEAVLAAVHQAGSRLYVNPAGQLAARGASRLSPELRTAIASQKPELLRLLAGAEPGCVQPYIDANGELHIHGKAPMRYRWWAGGQTIACTLHELGATAAVWRCYTAEPYPAEARP